MRGFSFYISFGKNKGFKLLEKDGPSILIKLWVVSICFTLTDIEGIFKGLLSQLKAKDFVPKDECKKEEIQEREKELYKKINDFKVEIKGLRKELEELVEENCDSQDRIDDLESETHYLKEKIEEFESQTSDFEAQVSDLDDDLNESNKENDELEEKLLHTQKALKKVAQNIIYLEIYFGLR